MSKSNGEDRDSTTVSIGDGSSLILHVDKDVGKHLIELLLSRLWWSSFFAAVATVGLIVACFFIYKNIGYTAVLEYDLMDLRAKVGEAHENTPEIDE